MSVGQTVVPYAMFQEAFQSNPDQLNSAVNAAVGQAAKGDPAQQQRMIAAWHDAIGVPDRRVHVIPPGVAAPVQGEICGDAEQI